MYTPSGDEAERVRAWYEAMRERSDLQQARLQADATQRTLEGQRRARRAREFASRWAGLLAGAGMSKSGVEQIRKAAGRLVQGEAERLLEADPSVGSIEQARARVRKERPDLARAERGEVDVSRLSSAGEPTLDERARKAVDAQAERLQAEPGPWFGRSKVACRGAVWRSDDGRRLAKLLRSGLTGAEVVKSRDPEVVEALQVLEVWER